MRYDLLEGVEGAFYREDGVGGKALPHHQSVSRPHLVPRFETTLIYGERLILRGGGALMSKGRLSGGVTRSTGLQVGPAGLSLWQVGLPFEWWVLDSVFSCFLQFSRVESFVGVSLLVWSV
jgi:hypothetical protein